MRTRSVGLLLLGVLFALPFATWGQARYALVIGNGAYKNVPALPNPVNDANDMAAVLRSLKFSVTVLTNADEMAMENAVADLGSSLSLTRGAIGLFYYAGHGIQVDGENYLIPVDARLPSKAFLQTQALALRVVSDAMNGDRQDKGDTTGLSLIVLDSCRDNPFPWTRGATRGLAAPSGTQPQGSLIAYATTAGAASQDGVGRNGLFTGYLLKNLALPGVSLQEAFNRTGSDVQKASRNGQVPAIYSQLFDPVYLAGPPAPVPPQAPPVAPRWTETQVATGSLSLTFSSAGTVEFDGKTKEVAAGTTLSIEGLAPKDYPLKVTWPDKQVDARAVSVGPGQNLALTLAPPAVQAPPVTPKTATESQAVVTPPVPVAPAIVAPPVVPSPKVYRVGDKGPAGGVVFYDKGNSAGGWRYLEAAAADVPGPVAWGPAKSVATTTTVGSGKANTALLVSALGATSAAGLCKSLSLGGFKDWFLPSLDELDLLYRQLRKVGKGLPADRYWSSSQNQEDDAWAEQFADGNQYNLPRSEKYRVRAIRMF
ncbi:MAG: caspase family protein [Spirochaetales bacterium]